VGHAAGLGAVKARVDPSVAEQHLVAPALDDATPVEDDDLVGRTYR
jgi:hypothetical protein